jgi:hypothetical protein
MFTMSLSQEFCGLNPNLKLANLLKLADFGLARDIGISARTYSPKV